jgi:alpha-tubulin suppressor-like RCC1 family protein
MAKADPRHRARIAAGQAHSMTRGSSSATAKWVDLYALKKLPVVGVVVDFVFRILRITTDTPVYAWGSNHGPGQLGVSGITQSRVPVRVDSDWGGVPIVSVAAGSSHSLALDAEGRVWAWGANPSGQLGDGSQQNQERPVRISLRAKCIAIAAGDAHSLAITSDGKLYAWGNGYDGQLGNGVWSGSGNVAGVVSLVPALVGGEDQPDVDTGGPGLPTLPSAELAGVQLAAGGLRHSLAVVENGRVLAWGNNTAGQCGQLPPPLSPLPGETVPPEVYVQPIAVLRAPNQPLLAKSIAAGNRFSVAASLTDEVFVWGGFALANTPAAAVQHIPRKDEGLSAIQAVSAQATGSWFLALDLDGRVWRGAADDTAPVAIPQLEGMTAIASGEEHSLALDTDGVVWAWGSNILGQVGIGSTVTSVAEPTPVQLGT